MTSPISNPANIITALNASATGPKQAGATSDKQFDQMLSRGIEERRSRTQQDNPVAKTATPAKPAAPSPQQPAKASKAASGEEDKTASIDEASTTVAKEDTATPVETGKEKPDLDAKDETEPAVSSAGADELLALVANLAEAGTIAVPVPAPAPAAAHTATLETSGEQAVATDNTNPIAAAAAAALPATQQVQLNAPTELTVTDLPVTDAAGNRAAQALLGEVRGQSTSAAPSSSEEAGTSSQFDTSLAEARDKKALADTNTKAGLIQPRSDESELPAAPPTGAELRAAKTAVDTQPIAAPVNSVSVAPQSPISHQQVQAAAAAAGVDRLSPRVGSDGWDQALGQKVVWMVAGEMQSASLTLNPPDLGPMEVVLNVSNNQANVTFTAAQPEVRQALEDAVPKLREMLGDAGIQLGQANVSAGTPNHQPGQSGEHRQGSHSAAQDRNNGEEASVHTIRSQTITGSGQGLVDTFA